MDFPIVHRIQNNGKGNLGYNPLHTYLGVIPIEPGDN